MAVLLTKFVVRLGAAASSHLFGPLSHRSRRPPFSFIMTVEHKVPLPPPTIEGLTRPTLTEEQQRKFDIVLAHFSNADYKLPDVEGEDAVLIEKERFWLVRLLLEIAAQFG